MAAHDGIEDLLVYPLDGHGVALRATVACERGYRALGYRSLETYARERLGISPRKARALLRLEDDVERALAYENLEPPDERQLGAKPMLTGGTTSAASAAETSRFFFNGPRDVGP